MQNAAYWRKRARDLENMAHASAIDTCGYVDKQYAIAQSEIDKQIRAWYSKYAANNEISYQEAIRELTAKERKELQWTVKDYIKHGRQLKLRPEWMKQMRNASAAHHITRLEALKLELQQSCEKLFGNQLDSVDMMVRSVFTDGYTNELFTIQKGTGVGWKVNSIDTRTLNKVINKPWTADGEAFSSRIWKNKDKLVNTLHTEITQSCITGRPVEEVSKKMAAELGTSQSNAARLVRTESAHFASQADLEAYNSAGIEKFQFLATLDDRTSDYCQDMDGQIMDLSEFEEGVTAPPLHPNCRSTTIPYFDDEFTDGDVRAARNDVPADMTYAEWKKEFC